MSNIFDYNPIQEWTGDVVDFGLPTVEGNRLISEIVTTALNAQDATQRCFEMSKTNEYFALASSPETLKLVRYFFTGDSELLGTLSVASVQSFIETSISGSGISTPTHLLDLIDTDDNGLLNITSRFVEKFDVLIDKNLNTSSSLTQSVVDIQYKPLSAVTNLNATDDSSLTPGVVLVDWNSDTSALSYNVYRSINKHAFDLFDPENLNPNQILLANIPNNSFADTTLDNIGTYYYWVSFLYNDPLDKGLCSNPDYSIRVECETPNGVWQLTPAHCSDPVWSVQAECETSGNIWIPDEYYCTNASFSGQTSCEGPRGTWNVFIRESLLSPDMVKCDLIGGCSLTEFDNQFMCEDSNTCRNTIDYSEILTSKPANTTPDTPALTNQNKCESLGSTGCYHSSNTSSWTWSSYNSTQTPNEIGCLNFNPNSYYIWYVQGENQWSGGAGTWNEDIWSAELCSSAGGTWTFAHPGEEGSIAGDPFIEKVDNMVASEGENFQITLTWTSNPTVDPLIGECADCKDGATTIQLFSEPTCIASGLCTDATYDNQEVTCIANGLCTYSAYTDAQSCVATRCSNSYWTNQSSCLAAGSCSYSGWNNQQSNCQQRGECWRNGTSYKGNITQSQCAAYDTTRRDWVNWYPNTWTSYGYTWQQQHNWNVNNFISDNYFWQTHPQYTDASSCAVATSTWVPDVTVQNTPDSYNIYRTTKEGHELSPPEYEFIANVLHVGSDISSQGYVDDSLKTKFILYYYKVTQISGGVESNFSIHDTGWENHA